MVCGLSPASGIRRAETRSPLLAKLRRVSLLRMGSVPRLSDGAKSCADRYSEPRSRYAGTGRKRPLILAARRSRGRRSRLTSRLEVEMTKTYLKRQAAQARAYSQAIVSEGGKVVWLPVRSRQRPRQATRSPAILTARCARCFPDW